MGGNQNCPSHGYNCPTTVVDIHTGLIPDFETPGAIDLACISNLDKISKVINQSDKNDISRIHLMEK